MEASSCTPSDNDVGTYHGHKCGNAVGEEGPGPGEDWGNEGFVLGSCEEKELFGVYDKGLEEGGEAGSDMVDFLAMELAWAYKSPIDGKKEEKL